MKSRTFLALPLLLGAAPALATGGFECRDARAAVVVAGTVGHTIASPLIGARLTIGDHSLSTGSDSAPIAIGRSWIDENEIKVDLVDPQALRIEAALRVTRTGTGWTGTLTRNGLTYPVRCVIE